MPIASTPVTDSTDKGCQMSHWYSKPSRTCVAEREDIVMLNLRFRCDTKKALGYIT